MRRSDAPVMLRPMSEPRADVISQVFPAAPRQVFRVARHYLLCTTQGVVQLEASGRSYSLPPARAALIRAGEPVFVTLPGPVTAASVLFDEQFLPAPAEALSVIDLTPLARSLIQEARGLGGASVSGGTAEDDYAAAILSALGSVVLHLARRPSPAWMPAAKTARLGRALELTAAALGDNPQAGTIAAAAGLSSRSLARHCAEELGMSWRAVLRRMRMIRAMELIATEDIGIAQTAFASGYNSVSAFTAAFQDFAGCSPSTWRRRVTTGRPER